VSSLSLTKARPLSKSVRFMTSCCLFMRIEAARLLRKGGGGYLLRYGDEKTRVRVCAFCAVVRACWSADVLTCLRADVLTC
jgi:hypothetical protein